MSGRAADLWPWALLATLALLMLGSLAMGRLSIPIGDVCRVLTHATPADASLAQQQAQVIVREVRLPRVLLTALCGLALGLSGSVLQGAFRNPLVGPEVVGVQGGATFGGVLAILISLPTLGVVGLAFGFGLLAMTLAFGVARLAGRSSAVVLVLAGLVVGVFFATAANFLKYVADPVSKLPPIVYWTLGSFTDADFGKVALMAACAVIGGVPLLLIRWRINLLALGQLDASALGVNVRLLRGAVVTLVALMTAAQVAVSGGVAWVGMIIPHMARMLVGPDQTRLAPVSGLLGAVYVLALDDVARSAAAQEIPIGVLTALIGSPLFALLLWRLKGRGWSEG